MHMMPNWNRVLMLATVSLFAAAANADSRVIAVGDMGTSPSHSALDGSSDLLWHDVDTGEVVIHYMDKDGVSAVNVIGSIDAIEIVHAGSNYFSTDELVVNQDGTGGTGLEAQMNVIGPIASVIIDDPGRDYTGIPALLDSNPESSGGEGFVAICVPFEGVAASGQVAKIKCIDGGSGYEPGAPLALIALPPNGSMDDAAVGTVFALADGTIPLGDVAIADNGDDFVTTPAVSVLAGEPATPFIPATFQAVLFGGIDQVIITAPGDGYTANPEFEVDDAGGSLASFTSSRGPGPVHSVVVTNPGRNYTLPPTLSTEGSGSGAEFEVPINSVGPRPITFTDSDQPISVNGGPIVKATLGDFDGDGDTDILWRREPNSQTYIWFLEDGKVLEAGELSAIADDWWHVVDAGDFDNDGVDDIYWWNHKKGHIAIWHIDYVPGHPEQWVSNRTSYAGTVPNLDWHPYAIRDITPAHAGDEILWCNVKTGAVAIRMRDSERPKYLAHAAYARTPDGALLHGGENWEARHFGDFDGNRFDGDIFWYNPVSKRVAIWRMNLNTVADAGYMTLGGFDAQTDYHPVGVSHHHVSGENGTLQHAHILWRHMPTSRVVNWRMDRTARASGASSEDDDESGSSNMLERPFEVDQAVLHGVDGINSDLDLPTGGGGIGGGDEDDKDDTGGSGYDINMFDPLDPSTWPDDADANGDGETTSDEMINWLGNNIIASDPSTWPDGIDSEDALATWLIQMITLLGSF